MQRPNLVYKSSIHNGNIPPLVSLQPETCDGVSEVTFFLKKAQLLKHGICFDKRRNSNI